MTLLFSKFNTENYFCLNIIWYFSTGTTRITYQWAFSFSTESEQTQTKITNDFHNTVHQAFSLYCGKPTGNKKKINTFYAVYYFLRLYPR